MDVMDKMRALQLAYQIVTDKRNLNRYGGTAIVRKDEAEMFAYLDMLNGLRALFKDLDDARKTPALQKPMTEKELRALIDAGEDVAVYCEAKGGERAYANILCDGCIIEPYGMKIKADMLDYRRYGIGWRAWASRPTDEERAAAPWEDAGDADL